MAIESWLMDMDGVLVHEAKALPGADPYFVGKPNPLMMRSALNALQAHSETTAMIGDRIDTDIVAGLEAGMETILVLSGVTTAAEAERFPYRPRGSSTPSPI
ncbi:MAG TPA: HAD hydrolase-like protein [Solirubrobacterales bacterium]|nr:HAD hydrolase-like protein [Solirubrobacterales bacterium]